MEKILETVSISAVTPYEKNPRHNNKAVTAVMASIDRCGYVAPIIVDEEYVILAGHTRYKALIQLGHTEVQIMRVTGLTEKQKRAYRVLDNKTAEIAEWDYTLLAQELEGLELEDIDLGGLQWFPEEEQPAKKLNEYDENEEEAVDVPEEPVTQPGDIWQLGKHRLLCGDSTKAEEVERLMQGEEADLLLTDPPYNVAYEGGTKDKLTIMNDHMENSAFLAFLKDAFVAAIHGLKDGASYYVWHADSEGENFRRACRESGLKVRQCLVWVKSSLVLGRQDYQWKHEPCLYGQADKKNLLAEAAEAAISGGKEKQDYITAHEPCLYGWKDGAPHKFYSDRQQTTVLQFDKPIRNGDHPTMKPVALFEYLINNSTKQGDIVLDTFGGSGTTVIACEKSGRIARTMELDPKYCDVIVRRWEQMTGETAVKI